MASGASTGCADYKIVGICYWLHCTYWKCSVRTSMKVHHFIPEMVVSVYNHNNQSPWKEVNFMNTGVMGDNIKLQVKCILSLLSKMEKLSVIQVGLHCR
ncbi:TraU family protein [Glaesserella parasuis]|nr:TraU family protein [Glaesserella parasuis]